MMPMTADQLTLAGLVGELTKVPQDAIVMFAGFGSGTYPGALFRHRPYVDGLAIAPRMGGPAVQKSAAELVAYLQEMGLGAVWLKNTPRDFVDPHPAGPETPMWVSTEHELSFNAITGIEMMKGFAVIRSVNLAPMQGPTIQRLSDAEVIERVQSVSLALRGEHRDPGPNASAAILRYIPKDRTQVRLNLEEARWELANFEASLQAKRDRVAKLEVDAACHDYFLGITDELPGILKVQES